MKSVQNELVQLPEYLLQTCCDDGEVIVFVFGTSPYNYKSISDINEHGVHTRAESVIFALAADDFQALVIHVQQWLRNNSATRRNEDFDDGFSEAEVHYLAGLNGLN